MQPLAEVQSIAVSDSRPLTRDELRIDLIPAVWREAKNDLPLIDDLGESFLPITDLAAAAIGVAMVKELGRVFEIPRDQYAILLWEYISHVASEKLTLALRSLR